MAVGVDPRLTVGPMGGTQYKKIGNQTVQIDVKKVGRGYKVIYSFPQDRARNAAIKRMKAPGMETLKGGPNILDAYKSQKQKKVTDSMAEYPTNFGSQVSNVSDTRKKK